MSEEVEQVIKSSQEQAVAAWVTYLNQVRLDELIEKLDQQDINLDQALQELDEIKRFLGDPAHILGNPATKHGEIAEHMQVNFENARRAIRGLKKNHTFQGVGRTAPADYMRDGQEVQSKFYNGLRNTLFGKHALQEHLKTYPDFVKNGGSYDIPKDQYQELIELLDKYKNDPSSLSTKEYNLAKKIDEFLKANHLRLGKDIRPAVVKYSQTQQGAANKTVDDEEKNIKKEDQKQRKKAYEESKPSFKEGAKVAAVSAAVEGGVTFCLSVAKKRKEKKFAEFTGDDWKEIGLETGAGTAKGGIRGGAMYVLSNFTATPVNVASAYVTAAFGIAAQVKALERKEVSAEDFWINCETVSLDVAVSAIASTAGQVLIPVPVLGAVIGNAVGGFAYELCKKYGDAKARKIAEQYQTEMAQLNQALDIKFLQVYIRIQQALRQFKDLETLAFDENVNIAFNASAKLAVEVGVAEDQILKNKEEIDRYFQD